MASTLKRIIAAAGTTALIAIAGAVVAPAARADGDYYGTWTLAAIKADGQKTKCEGPPGPQVCPGGETLKLTPNYRFRASSYLAQIMLFASKGAGKGYFATPVFPGTGDQTLVLEDDVSGILPLGSAWQMVLKDKRNGSPTKMVLKLQTGFGEFTLVLRRDAQ